MFGKAFVDVGSLWGLGGPAVYRNTVLDQQYHARGDGLGLQWVSPFGPIRIDYAVGRWFRTLGTGRENIRFSFGTRF